MLSLVVCFQGPLFFLISGALLGEVMMLHDQQMVVLISHFLTMVVVPEEVSIIAIRWIHVSLKLLGKLLRIIVMNKVQSVHRLTLY